jgi:hypothetical protein
MDLTSFEFGTVYLKFKVFKYENTTRNASIGQECRIIILVVHPLWTDNVRFKHREMYMPHPPRPTPSNGDIKLSYQQYKALATL